ncbi:MAG: RNA polymerase sigma factor [Chitinophagaceae bacterium]|nr:RNA polymerase sigma factor [Chitinophagaceae bacterium]
MTEEELIKLLQREDPDAFQELVTAYSKRVYNLCLNFVELNEDAEDITQEVFITIFKSVNGFQGESQLSTWIYRITTNKCLEWIRAKKRKKRSGPLTGLYDQNSGFLKYDPADKSHPGLILEQKDKARVLFSAIRQLPENQQTAYLLAKVEERSYAEVAEIMEVSHSSVESLLFRAKQNLKTILKEYYDLHK